MGAGSAQVIAWKDVEARDADAADHPAGEVRISQQQSSARVAILAGHVGSLSATTTVIPTIPSMSCPICED